MTVNAPTSSPDNRSSTTAHAYPPSLAPAGSAASPRGTDEEIALEHSPPLPSLVYDPEARESAYDLGDKAEASVVNVEVRTVLRTPSPTPSEARVLASKTRIFGDWRRYLSPKRYANWRGALTLAAVVVILIFVILFLVFQQTIVLVMQPFARWMHDTPGGWVIPIAIMFVLSFPPLFGHEIIAILCGDVWGVWIGFGIVAAGTLFGELGNFFAFKYLCNTRAKQLEERQLTWALYSQVARESGLILPTIMRLTFIPGHLLTAIFSTCGMSLWGFFVSATLSLPKQLSVVFIGVSQSVGGNTPTTSGIKVVVVFATFGMSYIAMRVVNKKVDEVKGRVVYARRKARQARMLRGEDPMPAESNGDDDEAQPEGALQQPMTSIFMPAPQRAVARPGLLEAEVHRPQPPPAQRGVRKLFQLGSRKKRGSDASDGNVGMDVLGSGDVVELELNNRRELRARRHAEEIPEGVEDGKGLM